MKQNIILIHGNGGSTVSDIWFPWAKAQFEKLGLDVRAQTMPDNVLARATKWLPFIENVLRADENSIIIGHSSGAVAAMRYAETHKLQGSVLIGACYTDLGDKEEKLSGYYDKPWQWEKIKANQKWIAQFASTDDPWIPIEEARYICEKLDTDYHEYTNQGHFGGDYDKKTFPELIAAVKKHIL